MKIKTTTLVLIFALLLVISAAALVYMYFSHSSGNIAQIYKNGDLLYEIDLSDIVEPYTIKLDGNIVLVEHGQISMLSASCPDKICVRTGVINSGAYPIVCLPNKVQIVIVRSGGDEVDAVAG